MDGLTERLLAMARGASHEQQDYLEVIGKRAGNTPRELEVDQREAPGCQRCGSNSSIRPAGCVGSRVSTSLM